MRVPLSGDELEKHLKKLLPIKEGFDLLSDHVIVTDANANILYTNKAVEKSTGFSAKEMMGKNPADLWGGHMDNEFYKKMWYTIKEEKKPFIGEVKNVNKQGREYWQELHVTPVLDEEGEVRYFIGIEPDITDRKTREKFKEEFINAVAHQLRNPITSIRWIIERLFSDQKFSSENKQELEAIHQEGETLLNFINDLLILARIEKGSLTSEVIHLDQVLSSCIETVREKYSAVVYSFQNSTAPVAIKTIHSLARQIFLNILFNAAEHADPQQGTVTLTLEQRPHRVIFSCHNNGPEIPQHIQPMIFSKVPSQTGEGLGLFLVKLITDYLGWYVSFETGKQGTTFFIDIPNAQTFLSDLSHEKSHTRLQKMILVVEDDSIMRNALAFELSKAGYAILTAADGEEAEIQAQEHIPDLILLDLILPKLNGFDLLPLLKENPATQHIPVIAISNLAQEADKQKAVKLGAQDVIEKSATSLDQIANKVKTFFT